MKEYTIIFPNDSQETINQKVGIIQTIAGENNVSFSDDMHEFNTPLLTIRCARRVWKEIKFQLSLEQVYW